jgi:hypothetical protein
MSAPEARADISGRYRVLLPLRAFLCNLILIYDDWTDHFSSVGNFPRPLLLLQESLPCRGALLLNGTDSPG